MWSPNSGTPLASLFCHGAPLLDCGVTRDGKYLVTSGGDAKINVFDLRTHGMVHSYFSALPATRIAVSQRGC